jgi:hypothetical protein
MSCNVMKCDVMSGETSWDRPKHADEKSPQKQTSSGSTANGHGTDDLSSLRKMREQADAKMAALRLAS